jgi:PAS domain S-box-containing protein
VTTRQKLYLGFGTLAALMVMMSVTVMLRLGSIEENLHQQANVARIRTDVTRQMEINVIGFALAIRTFAQTAEPEYRENAVQRVVEVERHLTEYRRLANTERQSELAAGFEERWRGFKTFGESFLDGKQPTTEEWNNFAGQRRELERFLDDEFQPDASATYDERLNATIDGINQIKSLAYILLAFFIFIALMTGAIVGKDIVKTEDTLRQSENQLHLVTDAMPVLISYVDDEHRYRFANQTYYDWFGHTPQEVIGQHLRDMLGETVYQTLLPELEKVFSGQSLQFERLLPYKDGGSRFVSVTYTPDVDETGRVKGFYALVEDIGKRKEAEKALFESEERFSEAFNASPLAITITELETGRLIEVNDTFVKVTGYSREEAIGRTTIELGLWTDSEDRDAELEAVAELGSLREHEYRFRLKDGSEIIGLLSAESIEIGGRPCALTVIQDITERKRAENLRATLAAIIETSEDAIVSKTLDGVITSWNAGAEKIFGFTAAEAVGQHIYLIIPSDLRDEEDEVLARLRRGEKVDHFETERVAKDGRRLNISVSISPVVDAAGNIIGASKVARDITEQHRTADALRKSEDRFARFMDNLPGLAWVKDTDGRYVYANESAVNVFDTPRERLYGKTDREIFPKLTAESFEKNDQNAASLTSGLQTVEVLEHKDGTVHHSIVSKFPIVDTDGKTTLIGGMAIDITDRLLAEEALGKSEEKYRTIFNSIDEGFCTVEIILDDAGKPYDYLFLEYNPIFEELTGLKDAVGKTVKELVPDLESFWIDTYGRVALTGESVRFESYAEPMKRWFNVYASRVGDETSLKVAIVFSNITTRKTIEQELRNAKAELERRVAARTAELAEVHQELQTESAERLRIEKERVRLLNQVVTIQNEERRRIARDLHDELGQQITALRLKLESAQRVSGNKETVSFLIAETQSIANALDKDISFLAWEIRPAELAETDLVSAAEAYVKQWSRFSSVKAEFRSSGFGLSRLEPEQETNFYRIIQEALNNTHKHARAANVSILLEKRRNEITLIVEDDGKGFDPELPNKKERRMGIIGMNERAALLGGTVEIESSPGRGTTIFVRIPVTHESTNAKTRSRKDAA